jgi:hypothetical protein
VHPESGTGISRAEAGSAASPEVERAAGGKLSPRNEDKMTTQFIQIGKKEVINTAHIIRALIRPDGEMRVVSNETLPPGSEDTFPMIGWEILVEADYADSAWTALMSMRPLAQVLVLEDAALDTEVTK